MVTEAELHAWLDRWQSRLGLTHWDIQLVIADCNDETSTAECHRSDAYDRATIVIAPWVLAGSIPAGISTRRAFTAREVELAVIHELLHCHTRDLVYCTDLVADDLSPRTSEILDAAVERAEEQLIDRLSRSLIFT